MTIPDNKQAITDYPIAETIANRWSPRSFADREIPRETILSIFEAARWTMSSFGEEPWRYIVVFKSDTDEFQKALDCLDPFNQAWAASAPVLVFGSAKQYFQDDKTKQNKHAAHDLGAASAMLTIEAMRHGVFVHQMAGVLFEKVRETYEIPEGYEPMTAIALGYIGDYENLPKDLQEREVARRSRKPLGEIAFKNSWENPLG